MAFLSTMLRAATPENPRFNLSSAADVEAFLEGSGGGTDSGASVNHESALTYSPWWRGVNLISRDVGKLPLHIYRRQGEGKERATEHQAYRLIRRKPNAYQTSLIFRQQLTGHALSTGNGYAYIFRRGDASPEELIPLDPQQTWPVKENGAVLYLTKVDGEDRKLLAENVLHIKGFGYDGLCGYPVWQKAKESIGLGMGAKKYSSVYFKNSARPSVVLEHPAKLDVKVKETLAKSWERIHQGLDNAHRTAILDAGLKANVISLSAEDSQLLETRQFEIREVANFLGVPPHKLGDTTRTAYASLEQENQSYLDDALDYWLCVWEEECWDKLLTEEEKEADTHIIEFLRAALLRADLGTRSNYYRTALAGAPWMTRNEVRGAENLNPVEGGNEIIEPMNMGQGGGDNLSDEPTSPPPGRPAKAGKTHRELLMDAAARMVRRVGTHAQRAAKQPGSFVAWLDGLAKEHGETFSAALGGESAEWLLQGIRESLLSLSGACAAKELEAAVGRRMIYLEENLPAALASRFLGDE